MSCIPWDIEMFGPCARSGHNPVPNFGSAAYGHTIIWFLEQGHTLPRLFSTPPSDWHGELCTIPNNFCIIHTEHIYSIYDGRPPNWTEPSKIQPRILWSHQSSKIHPYLFLLVWKSFLFSAGANAKICSMAHTTAGGISLWISFILPFETSPSFTDIRPWDRCAHLFNRSERYKLWLSIYVSTVPEPILLIDPSFSELFRLPACPA